MCGLQYLWHMGLVAPQRVGSSRNREGPLRWQADAEPPAHWGRPAMSALRLGEVLMPQHLWTCAETPA